MDSVEEEEEEELVADGATIGIAELRTALLEPEVGFEVGLN